MKSRMRRGWLSHADTSLKRPAEILGTEERASSLSSTNSGPRIGRTYPTPPPEGEGVSKTKARDILHFRLRKDTIFEYEEKNRDVKRGRILDGDHNHFQRIIQQRKRSGGKGGEKAWL
jgi:hypothetical protein